MTQQGAHSLRRKAPPYLLWHISACLQYDSGHGAHATKLSKIALLFTVDQKRTADHVTPLHSLRQPKSSQSDVHKRRLGPSLSCFDPRNTISTTQELHCMLYAAQAESPLLVSRRCAICYSLCVATCVHAFFLTGRWNELILVCAIMFTLIGTILHGYYGFISTVGMSPKRL